MQCRRPGFNPWVGKIPWRREQLPTPIFWPGEFHGLHSSWGHKESNMTEPLSLFRFLRLWENNNNESSFLKININCTIEGPNISPLHHIVHLKLMSEYFQDQNQFNLFFKLEYNCFTMLFILYREVNLLYVYIYPLPHGPASHHPHPTF